MMTRFSVFLFIPFFLRLVWCESGMNENATQTATTMSPDQLTEALKLGNIDFGVTILDVDFNKEKSRQEVAKIFDDIAKKTAKIEVETRAFEALSTSFSVASLFTQTTGLSGIGKVLGTVLDLLFPEDKRFEEILKAIGALKDLMLQEFDKITKLLQEQFLATLLQMKFLDYRASVADVIGYGVGKMYRFLTKKLPQNLQEFKDWCGENAPIDVAVRMRTRISGETSLLKAFLEALNFDHKSYRAFENGFIGHMRSLELLMANCEAVQPISMNGSIFADFANVEKELLDALTGERARLETTFWPGKVLELVRQQINQTDKTNKGVGDRVAAELAAKHEPLFFTVFANFGKPFTLYYTGDRVVTEINQQGKNYVVFRTACSSNETERQRIVTQTDQIVNGVGDAPLIAKLLWETLGIQSRGDITKSALVLAVDSSAEIARSGNECAVYAIEKNNSVYMIGLN